MQYVPVTASYSRNREELQQSSASWSSLSHTSYPPTLETVFFPVLDISDNFNMVSFIFFYPDDDASFP